MPTTATTSDEQRIRSQVQFSDRIGIQEYSIVPGDNPACTSGAPIQLGWKIESTTERNFSFYEHFRSAERLRGKQLKIPPLEREQMLISAGFSSADCLKAEQRNKSARKRRLESLTDEGWDRMSIMLLSQTGGLPAKSLLRRNNNTDETSSTSTTQRLERFRKSFSLRRERSVNVDVDEEQQPRTFSLRRERSIKIQIEDDDDDEEQPQQRKSKPEAEFTRSFSFRRERSVKLSHDDGDGDDDVVDAVESTRPRQSRSPRSFSFRRGERSIDLSSSSSTPAKQKLGWGLWKATGESLRQIVLSSSSSPATKNARSA